MIKKYTAILLCLALILSLAACTDSGTPEPAPAEAQIAVMVAAKDAWIKTGEEYATFYAVTDLNGNGRLELLRGGSEGMWTSRDAFFEISEDSSELKELAFPFGEDHSHPDLVEQDAYRMYIGPEGRYLIAKDDIYLGPVQASNYSAYHVLDYLQINEGEVDCGDIAWCSMMDEDTNGDGLYENHIRYYTGKTDEIDLDGEGYVNEPSEQFPGYEEQVCRIAWWTLDTYESEEADVSDETVRTGLVNSWEQFSVAPDADTFGGLVEDPYYSFYAAGAGGAKIYLDGEEVPYFPSFMDIRGTWYLQNAWTDEATWYVGRELSAGELNILDDGLLYADYSNTADPRGPYLITEMKETFDSKAEGTDGDDWVIVYESDDGEWEMQLRPDPDRKALYVTWYEWPDGNRMAEPTGINLEYSRIAG